MGSYYPREFLNSGLVLLKQAEHYLDPLKRLALARAFVEGAIKNSISTLKKHQNKSENVSKAIEKLSQHLSSLNDCRTIEQLMAVEGNAKEVYYHTFDTCGLSLEFCAKEVLL